MRTNRRSLILPLSALLTAAAGSVQAAPMDAMAEGSLRPWSVPGRPVSEKALTGFQAFLGTDIGTGLAALSPSLRVAKALDPKSEAHLRAAGTLVLSKGKVRKAVKTRADEIAAAAKKDALSIDELSAAASELAPFAPISASALTVQIMALEARWKNTMAGARRIASELEKGKGLVALDPNLGRNFYDLVPLSGWKDGLPIASRLRPAGDPSQNRRLRDNAPAAGRPLADRAISREPDKPRPLSTPLVGAALTAILSLTAAACLTVILYNVNRFFVASAASTVPTADEREQPNLY